mmetsp:Transcript_21390/g.67752  ORF Transcript_21390/g.67752 Transcript_21390/m.67752 type:complete len:267 (+) Transcript_21390:267-1067(+)
MPGPAPTSVAGADGVHGLRGGGGRQWPGSRHPRRPAPDWLRPRAPPVWGSACGHGGDLALGALRGSAHRAARAAAAGAVGGAAGLRGAALPADGVPLELHVAAGRVGADPVAGLEDLLVRADVRLCGAAEAALLVALELHVAALGVGASPVPGPEHPSVAGHDRVQGVARWEGLPPHRGRRHTGGLGGPAPPAGLVLLELHVPALGVGADPVAHLRGLVVAAHHGLRGAALATHEVPLELVVPTPLAVPVTLPEGVRRRRHRLRWL